MRTDQSSATVLFEIPQTGVNPEFFEVSYYLADGTTALDQVINCSQTLIWSTSITKIWLISVHAASGHHKNCTNWGNTSKPQPLFYVLDSCHICQLWTSHQHQPTTSESIEFITIQHLAMSWRWFQLQWLDCVQFDKKTCWYWKHS